jgi:hypothetical protein
LFQSEKWAKEAEKLFEAGDQRVLEKCFLKRMEFGTAGLRGRMGPGFSQMNDLVIIQTAQGLLKYLQATDPNLTSTGLVLGYDARHNSRRSVSFSHWLLTWFVNVYSESGCTPNYFNLSEGLKPSGFRSGS